MRFKLLAISALSLATVFATAQVSTFGVRSSAFVGASNTEFFPYSIPSFDASSNETGAPVTAQGGQTFSGLNGNNDPDTMEFNGVGFASAQFGSLKSSAAGEVQNSFYNSSNDWYWNSNTNELNEDGTPDVFVSGGQATFYDQFTYTNYGPAVTVNFFFQVSGNISGDDAYHSLGVTVDNDFDYLFLDQFDGSSFNQTWVTKNYSIGDGTIDLNVNSLSSFSMETQFWADGTNVSGAADFSSTSTLVGMQLLDGNGMVVNGWSMSSASGTTYPVPEPTSMTLLAVAALGAIAKKCKK